MRKIDNLYYCKACKKNLWQFSVAKTLASYCSETGKNVILVRMKTVKLRLTIGKWLVDFLNDEAARHRIGFNECFNQMMRKGMELEKKERETLSA